MATKVYKAKSKLTTPVVVGNRVVRYAEFSEDNYTYVTSDEGVQQALEKSPAFGSYYVLLRTSGDTIRKESGGKLLEAKVEPREGVSEVGGDWVEYPDVKDWQAAKEVLRGEPFKVAYQVLGSPEAIARKAEELKVRFPNLVK